MKRSAKEKNAQEYILLRRMRESAELTMRQVGGMIGVSHVTISQFENGKLELPRYRIEQLVTAYGLSMDDFNKILGRPPVIGLKDDCHAMIDRMSEDQLVTLRGLLKMICSGSANQSAAVNKTEKSQIQSEQQLNIA